MEDKTFKLIEEVPGFLFSSTNYTLFDIKEDINLEKLIKSWIWNLTDIYYIWLETILPNLFILKVKRNKFIKFNKLKNMGFS